MQRLSICLCINQFYPVQSGAERQALLQGAELVRRGHKVHVITSALRGEPAESRHLGVQIHRAVRPVSLGPAYGATFIAGMAAALLRLRNRFQIVHTHQAFWEPCATGLARRLLGRPVLVQPAGSGYYGEMQTLDRTRGRARLLRLILRNDHFAAISDEIVEELTERGVPRSQITLTASGVDTEQFAPGDRAAARKQLLEQASGPGPPSQGGQSRLADAGKPWVVFTGRLHPQKNLPVLLDAWASVSREQPGELFLLGDGPDRNDLMRHAKRLDCEQSVHFLGRVDDVAEWLRAADVFALPSVAEGSSNSLLEAMASALPCVVSRIGGNVDLVEHGRTGLLVDPADPSGWREAILRILRRPEQRFELGAAARRWIVAERSMPAIVDRYEQLYGRLLETVRA